MAPPDNDRTAIGDGAFQHLGALVDIINNYAERQGTAQDAVDTALGLDKIFVGEEGAGLAAQIRNGPQNIDIALVDTLNTVNDLVQLGINADLALRNISNIDEVLAGLFRPETLIQGDPSAYDRPQYAPDSTMLTPEGEPVPTDLRGPNSIEEEMAGAQQVADEIEQERDQRGPGS